MNHSVSQIDGIVRSPNVSIGRGVTIGSGTLIEAEVIVIGDNCFVGEDVTIRTKEFWLGDYSKIQRGTVGFGSQALRIGRNCWIGGRCDLDSQGGLVLEDNVGVGSLSQIWTHIRHGDVVNGCRFDSSQSVTIGKDAWFVGSCLVSPVSVGERSMAMLGSVIVKDMLPDRTYGGSPAIDITQKVGSQFAAISIEEKASRLQHLISKFEITHPEFANQLVVVMNLEDINYSDERTYFDVGSRSYSKKFTPAEVCFLKQTGTVKFTPLSDT